jgi:tRNA U34 5-methylaminomethyl-2-thiouridine-forming methyltransferase MnmC
MQFIETSDSSNTLFSTQFNQHYHSLDDGALNESMSKYIYPTFDIFDNLKSKKSFAILDICFGLGYNTFATLLYLQKHNINIPITIYSPEFDTKLLGSLVDFEYPKEFEEIKDFKKILKALSQKFYFKNDKIEIIIKNGDAREYLKEMIEDDIKIDAVYQDAFSSDVNPLLWTKEYFEDISRLSNIDTVICTYSIATSIRIGMYEAGFKIYDVKYQIQSGKTKKMTIASKSEIPQIKDFKIDMQKKIKNTTTPYPLKDKEF